MKFPGKIQDWIEHLNSCCAPDLKITEETIKQLEEFIEWRETEEKMGKRW